MVLTFALRNCQLQLFSVQSDRSRSTVLQPPQLLFSASLEITAKMSSLLHLSFCVPDAQVHNHTCRSGFGFVIVTSTSASAQKMSAALLSYRFKKQSRKQGDTNEL